MANQIIKKDDKRKQGGNGYMWETLAIAVGATVIATAAAILLRGLFKKKPKEEDLPAKPPIKAKTKPSEKVVDPSAVDDALINKLREAKQQALKAQAYSNYYDKRSGVMEPLQELLGVAKDAVADDERQLNRVERIVKDICDIMGGGYKVEEPRPDSVSREYLEKARRESREKVEDMIDDCNLDVKTCAISFAYKNVMDAFGTVMPKLENMAKSRAFDKAAVREIAAEIRHRMEEKGIYPKDAPDDVGPGYSGCFSQTKPDALKYPALFIKLDDGSYELLKAYRGSI